MPNIGRPTSTNQPVPTLTSGMQSGNQHSMASQGNQQTPQGPSQGQSDPSAMLSPPGGPMQLAFPTMMPQQQAQYQVMVNQQGQQVLVPMQVGGFAGQMATIPTQGAQPTGAPAQYVMIGKGAGQQAQLISTPTAAASQTTQGKAGAQYTLTSTGPVLNTASAPPQNFFIQSMGGSPTVQPANPGMMPNTSHPSHVKTEAGKQHQIQSNQTATSAGGQTQQMTAPQPQMILPPSMTFVNPAQTTPGQTTQAYMGQNGQIFMVNKAQDAGQPASQIIFSPQSLQMQPHPQALQPNLNQQMPPGLTTSMTPMAMTSAASSGNNMVRTTYTTNQPPTGKTQISRAPPTLLPATSTMTTTTSRPTTTTTSFQPSPKSKQKMSPKGPPPHNKTNLPPKNILNTIKNNSNNSVSPPVLTSHGSPITNIGGPPGSPFSVGPPVLQTSLAIPPPLGTAHSQPPTLHPMNSPMLMPTSVQGNIVGQHYMNKSSSMAPSLTNIGGLKPTESVAMTSTKTIMPANKKATGTTTAAPMEQVGKPLTMTEVNGKSEVKSLTKPPTETLTHVIDGHVIQESSQPFPMDDDGKGKFFIQNNFPIN